MVGGGGNWSRGSGGESREEGWEDLDADDQDPELGGGLFEGIGVII